MSRLDAQRDAPLVGVTGVALAGGRGSRMGRDKAALILDGRPLVARAVQRLRLALAEVIVIGPDALAALQPGAPVFPDTRPGLGPLGGLATALDATATEWLVLVACDMPFIQPGLIHHMAALALAAPDADVVALRSPSGLEPLHAAYRLSVAPQVAQTLGAAHPSMRLLLSRLRVVEVAPIEVARLDPLELSTFNANTPEDWRRALTLVAEGVR